MDSHEGKNILNQLKNYDKPESVGDMPNNWELPEKEQKLIRALQRGEGDTEACARELMEQYNWGVAKVKRVVDKSPGVVP